MSPWLVLVPIGVFGGFLVFVWHRLAVAPRWSSRWVRYAVAITLVVLTALAFAGFDAWGGWWTPAQMRPGVWLGQAFLASCLYLFLGLVPVWLACVVIWLVRRGHCHGNARTVETAGTRGDEEVARFQRIDAKADQFKLHRAIANPARRGDNTIGRAPYRDHALAVGNQQHA